MWIRANALLQAQKYESAVRALRYASTAFRDAADWATLGGAAWYEEDDETAADAYARVYDLKRGRMEAAELATFATALANAGDYARCEEVARQLMAAALEDPALLAAGNHAMAVGYAARVLGTTARVVMPKTANPYRVARCRELGAEVDLVDDVHVAF